MTDDFVMEQEYAGQAHWFVQLSSGEEVVQDDGRPGLFPVSAWLRLKERVERERLRIERIGLRFRSHIVRDVLPTYAEGYCFLRASLAAFGSPESADFYVVGCLKQGVVHARRFSVPELVLIDESERTPESVGETLILNP